MPDLKIARQGLTFDEKAHKYFFDGRHVPNVTTLLEDYGLIDLSDIPKDRLEYKKIVGISVDYACHLLSENNLDEQSIDACDLSIRPRFPKHESIKPYIEAYKRFCEITGFEPILSKKKMYSRVWGFAGEVDSVAAFTWKGRHYKNAILDWKCVWMMYYSCGPQTAGYEILYEENYKTKADGRFGIQLKPTGTFEVYHYTKPSDKNVFLSCVTIENARRENKLLKTEEI